MELRNRAVERAESAGEISSAETAPTARGAPRKTREPPPLFPSQPAALLPGAMPSPRAKLAQQAPEEDSRWAPVRDVNPP